MGVTTAIRHRAIHRVRRVASSGSFAAAGGTTIRCTCALPIEEWVFRNLRTAVSDFAALVAHPRRGLVMDALQDPAASVGNLSRVADRSVRRNASTDTMRTSCFPSSSSPGLGPSHVAIQEYRSGSWWGYGKETWQAQSAPIRGKQGLG